MGLRKKLRTSILTLNGVQPEPLRRSARLQLMTGAPERCIIDSEQEDHLAKLSLEIICHILDYLPLHDLIKMECQCKKLKQAVDLHLRLRRTIDFTEGKIYGWMPDKIYDSTLIHLLSRCSELEYIHGFHARHLVQRRHRGVDVLSITGVINALSCTPKLKAIELSEIFLLEAILKYLPKLEILGTFKNRDGFFPILSMNKLTVPSNPRITSLHLTGVVIPELPRMQTLKHLYLRFVRLTLQQPFRDFYVPSLQTFVMAHCAGPINPLRYVPLISALAAAKSLSRLELLRVPFLGGLIQHIVDDSWRIQGFRNLQHITFGACKHALEVDMGFLIITASSRLTDLCVQPSLTKDSLFSALTMAEVTFPVFNSLILGFVDTFPESGKWSNDDIVGQGLADVTENPAMITDIGMAAAGRCFPSVTHLEVYNCPHLHFPTSWFRPSLNTWSSLRDLHLRRCHAIRLDDLCRFIPLLPALVSLHLEYMLREPPKGCARVGLSAGTGLGVSSALVQNNGNDTHNQPAGNNGPAHPPNQQANHNGNNNNDDNEDNNLLDDDDDDDDEVRNQNDPPAEDINVVNENQIPLVMQVDNQEDAVNENRIPLVMQVENQDEVIEVETASGQDEIPGPSAKWTNGLGARNDFRNGHDETHEADTSEESQRCSNLNRKCDGAVGGRDLVNIPSGCYTGSKDTDALNAPSTSSVKGRVDAESSSQSHGCSVCSKQSESHARKHNPLGNLGEVKAESHSLASTTTTKLGSSEAGLQQENKEIESTTSGQEKVNVCESRSSSDCNPTPSTSSYGQQNALSKNTSNKACDKRPIKVNGHSMCSNNTSISDWEMMVDEAPNVTSPKGKCLRSRKKGVIKKSSSKSYSWAGSGSTSSTGCLKISQSCQAVSEEIRETTKKAKENEEANKVQEAQNSAAGLTFDSSSDPGAASNTGGSGVAVSAGTRSSTRRSGAHRAVKRKSNMCDQATSTSDPVNESDHIQVLTIKSQTLTALTLYMVGVTDLVIKCCPNLSSVSGSACRVLKRVKIQHAPKLSKVSFAQCKKLEEQHLVTEVVKLSGDISRIIFLRPMHEMIISMKVLFEIQKNKYHCLIYDHSRNPMQIMKNQMQATSFMELLPEINRMLIDSCGIQEEKCAVHHFGSWDTRIQMFEEVNEDGNISEIKTDVPWLMNFVQSNNRSHEGGFHISLSRSEFLTSEFRHLQEVLAEERELGCGLHKNVTFVYINTCDTSGTPTPDLYV